MKILICGSGSIALRHYKNLISIGYNDIIFYKSTKYFREKSKLKNNKIYYNLKKALNQKPDVAFICNVTSQHMNTAIECAKKKCHLFVEKPISHNLKNISKLKNIINKNRLFFFVAYMMRFHPLIKKIKKFTEKKKSKIFYAHSIWGEFLPDWHPKENYKKSYASKAKLGGGVKLTLSHDLDLMHYLFGKIKSMKILNKFNSQLKINADVGSTYLIRFLSGVDCSIHLNYLNKPPIRDLKILGENIQIFFNYYKSELSIIEKNKKQIYKLKNFKRNDMFIDELKYFFKCLKINKKSNLENDFYLLKYIV